MKAARRAFFAMATKARDVGPYLAKNLGLKSQKPEGIGGEDDTTKGHGRCCPCGSEGPAEEGEEQSGGSG